MLRLLQNGRRISQYLRSKALRAPGNSAPSRMRARPSTSGPVMRPPAVQGATSTRELLRILLYFQESSRVITYSLPFSSANHSGVRTACPFLRKLATLMYFFPARFANGFEMVNAAGPRGSGEQQLFRALRRLHHCFDQR